MVRPSLLLLEAPPTHTSRSVHDKHTYDNWASRDVHVAAWVIRLWPRSIRHGEFRPTHLRAGGYGELLVEVAVWGWASGDGLVGMG